MELYERQAEEIVNEVRKRFDGEYRWLEYIIYIECMLFLAIKDALQNADTSNHCVGENTIQYDSMGREAEDRAVEFLTRVVGK